MTVLGEEWKYSHLASNGSALTGTINSVFSAGTHSIAAKSGDAIYYSSDSGVTWTKGTSTVAAFASATFNSVYLLADGHAIAGSTAGIYYSSDFGVTWYQVVSTIAVSFNSVYMLADGHAIAGSTTGVYYSILGNFGAAWTQVASTAAITFNSVYMIADGSAVAGSTSNGLYYSAAASFGVVWLQATGGTTSSFVSVALVGAKAIAGSSTTNGGIYYSTNSGASWTQSLTTGSINSVFFLLDGVHAIAGSSSNGGVLYSTDGGVSWDTGAVKTNECCCYNTTVTTGSFSSVFMLSNGNAIAGSTAGLGIWYSSNYGLSWKMSTQIMSGFKSVFMLSDYAIAGSGTGGPLLYSIVYINPCCCCCEQISCCCETNYYHGSNKSRSPKLYTYSHSKKKSVEEDKGHKKHKKSSFRMNL